jgi:1-acyl-sn-glycerol-3-phosphate acyltransferase
MGQGRFQIGSDIGLEPAAVRFFKRALRRLARDYFHLTVQGGERIPPRGGAIVAANHPSVLDGILLLAVAPRPVRFLVAEELYTHPLINPLFRAFGCIEVYRTKTHNGDALRAAVAALEQGDLLGIFPEGTTRFRGTMPSLKTGVALLALKTGLPVIPLAFQGSQEAFPEGATVPSPKPIQMTFGEPFAFPQTSVERIPDEEVAETLDVIQRRILATMLRAPQPAGAVEPRFGWCERLRLAIAALVVLPLARCLTLTANPGLDPTGQG